GLDHSLSSQCFLPTRVVWLFSLYPRIADRSIDRNRNASYELASGGNHLSFAHQRDLFGLALRGLNHNFLVDAGGDFGVERLEGVVEQGHRPLFYVGRRSLYRGVLSEPLNA